MLITRNSCIIHQVYYVLLPFELIPSVSSNPGILFLWLYWVIVCPQIEYDDRAKATPLKEAKTIKETPRPQEDEGGDDVDIDAI